MPGRAEQQELMQTFADELRAAYPHAEVKCDLLDQGGAWIAMHGPSRVLELQWSPIAGKFGVSLGDEDADVAFAGHDEYFPTFELAKARVLALLARADALGHVSAKRA
jgi:hypothetical protein